MVQAIESVGDPVHATGHRADEAVFEQRRPILRTEQFDGLQSHGFARDAEVFEFDIGIAPFADGVVDAAFECGTGGAVSGCQAFGQTGCGGNSNGASSHFA